jgi:hypothetical protein
MQRAGSRGWLVDELPVLFGGFYSIAEYDAKHLTVRELAGGGSAEGAVGISNAEFRKYLPGIYWLTVFGPELAAALDFSGLSRLPVTLTTLPRGSRVLQIDEPLITEDMAKRLELEARIADRAVAAVVKLMDVIARDNAALEAYLLTQGITKSSTPAPKATGF